MSITRMTPTAALVGLLWTASPVLAQTFHMPATPEKGVWMEATYADLEIMETSFPSSTWFVSGRMPITSGMRVQVDVPFAHAKVGLAGGPKTSNSVLGNPYVGVEFPTRSVLLETGLRLPLNTADDESFADVVALLGDFQRFEAFAEDLVPLYGAVTYRHGLGRGVDLQARTGLVALLHTGDEDDDNDALIDYGLLATYPTGAARFGLGFYGRWIATSDEGSFGDNSVHHASLTADYEFRGVRPGISVRVPVDSAYEDIVNSTVGFYLQVPLR